MNGFVKSGYANMGVDLRDIFSFSKDSCCSLFKGNVVSFFKRLVKGLAMLEKSGINDTRPKNDFMSRGFRNWIVRHGFYFIRVWFYPVFTDYMP